MQYICDNIKAKKEINRKVEKVKEESPMVITETALRNWRLKKI